MTEILHSGRTLAGRWVSIDIHWSDDLEQRESVTWSVFVTSAESDETVQLGYRTHHRPGVEGAEQFVTDVVSGRRSDVSPNADFRNHEITVRFPADIVGLAAQWPTWRAVITVDGVDVAEDVSTPV